MRCITMLLLAASLAGSAGAQQQAEPPRVGSGTTTFSDTPNLTPEKLGKGDLVGISVYDAPELSRTVRVGPDGNIRLPMTQRQIHAEGLIPAELENAITGALVEERLMVSPVVTVTVVEYRSRPITVVGAVRAQTTFQANGSVTLLEAITRAGGLSENAGADILVSRPSLNADNVSATLTERVSVHALLDASNPASNMKLEGGETIRVTNGGQLYIVGNVKHPGAFPLTSDTESSVLKAMALSGGLESFSSHTAYIYRMNDSNGHKEEIPVPITKIMAREAPDVPLYGNDVLYVPGRNGQRVSARALQIAAGVGLGIAGILIYVIR
ncbi:MAG: polysaccharide biosynthesis/export family protein [Acidobacteriaceae bacterium]|nr:polysaccharide biosynthesis/export family protein [Acidobacteriaceae bacterium]